MCVQPCTTPQLPPPVLLSQVWAPACSWVASGTNLHCSLNNDLPPTSGFARKRPPLRSAAKAQDLVCAPSNRGFPLKCQRPPGTARVLRTPRFQQSPAYRFTPGTRQVGWGGVSCPHLPHRRASSCRRQPLALLAGQGCPGGHSSAPGSGSPSCDMKAETILQEIK